MEHHKRLAAVALLIIALGGTAPRGLAQITDFTAWSPIQDPPHPQFNASTTPNLATLTAGNGPIPAGTDIGYASVNGPTVAGSTSGFYFEPTNDFLIAIDFDLSFTDAADGALAVGFGVGQDVAGNDSAGVVSLRSFGTFLSGGVVAAARDGDLAAGSAPLAISPVTTGSFLIAYAAATGNLTAGYSPTPGDSMAANAFIFPGLQNLWDDQGLLVSFFLRSDGTLGKPWTAGNATAAFSNFRVLGGNATTIPEPTTMLLMVGLTTVCLGRRRRSGMLP